MNVCRVPATIFDNTIGNRAYLPLKLLVVRKALPQIGLGTTFLQNIGAK